MDIFCSVALLITYFLLGILICHQTNFLYLEEKTTHFYNRSLYGFFKSFNYNIFYFCIPIWPLLLCVTMVTALIMEIYIVTTQYKLERRFISLANDDL